MKDPKEDYHSNWATLLSSFKFSTKEFYERVKSEMLNHGIENPYIKREMSNYFASSMGPRT